MTFRFCSLSSGSSGNCQYVEANKSKILIDSGFSGVKIEGLLKSIGVEVGEIDYILVTHEHTDHMKSAGILSRRYDIPIVANKGTWEGMYENKLGKIKEAREILIDSDKSFELGDFGVEPFRIYHDAREPLGYILHYGNRKISLMTDTGRVDRDIVSRISASDLYFIEANHDIFMLENGLYPYYLKRRVKSDFGHLSNDDAGDILLKTLRDKGERIILGHLSKDNNIPDLARDTVLKTLDLAGLKTTKVDLSFRDKPTEIYTIK